MRKAGVVTAAVLLAVCLTPAARGEVWDPDVIPERGVDYYDWGTFVANYSGVPWEIKNVIEHQDGYLGAFNVHDSFTVGFTVGIVGGKASGNTKTFAAPVATVWVYEDGLFSFEFTPEACAN